MKTCRWAGKQMPRLIPGAHDDDCPREGCKGCLPCPERHCQVCGKEHITVDGRGRDETCTGCLSEVRTNIGKIGTLSAKLLGEAILRGINSEAAMLEGPAGDPEAWSYRRASALAGRIDAGWLEDNHDELHPLWVLGTWEQAARDHLAQPTDDRVTLTEARVYLDQHLGRLAHDPGFPFGQLAGSVHDCVTHLEDVLSEGERDELGAPCVQCGKTMVRIVTDKGATDDYWCERCKRKVPRAQYLYAVGVAAKATAARLPAKDLAERIDVPASTVRRWASVKRTVVPGRWEAGVWVEGEILEEPPLLRWCGLDASGRRLYRVSDAEQIRDELRANQEAS